MKVFYNNFWPNFNNKSHNDLFEKIFQTTVYHTDIYEEADILCESTFIHAHYLYKKSWKYSFLISYENYLSYGNCLDEEYLKSYTCILSGFEGWKNQISFPYLFERMLDTHIPLSTMDVPQKSACAVISNPSSSFRNRFLDILDNYIHVDYGGPYKNNIGYLIEGGHTGNNLLDFYKQYKFVIAIENSVGEYYITEKIYNALTSGRIPVYWGSPNISKIINPKRFLHIRNDSNDEIMRVIHIMQTMTDDKYQSILREPIFVKPFDLLLTEKIEEIRRLVCP